jgi:hypothetical protein
MPRFSFLGRFGDHGEHQKPLTISPLQKTTAASFTRCHGLLCKARQGFGRHCDSWVGRTLCYTIAKRQHLSTGRSTARLWSLLHSRNARAKIARVGLANWHRRGLRRRRPLRNLGLARMGQVPGGVVGRAVDLAREVPRW